VKKNVLQFIGSFHQGGSERQAVGLTRLLKENGEYNVFAATLNREGVLLDEMEKLGFDSIPEFKLTSFYNLNFLAQIRKCARFLRENRIDIIQTHDFYTNVFGILAATLARTPLKIASKRETGGMRSASQKRVEKFAFRLSDAIVVNSGAVRDHLLSRSVAPGKISVIYNGLDLERLRPKTTDRAAICRELGLPETEGVRFITLVANLRHEVKNQPMFLRAAQRVLQKFPATHFVLAGEGDLQPALENQTKELGISENVHFIGRCDELAELLLISYACVLTSFAEGFSNSIIEYMAAGKPVVATKVGGAAEAVVEGETGYLVPSDDDKAMAERLVELLGDEQKALAMGVRGKTIAEEKFSSQVQLSKVLELYGRAPK
jgi:glycosyltransferase involved in cell wall biosynthesis